MEKFDITLTIQVECQNLKDASELADAIILDLKKTGEMCIDRPIVWWSNKLIKNEVRYRNRV